MGPHLTLLLQTIPTIPHPTGPQCPPWGSKLVYASFTFASSPRLLLRALFLKVRLDFLCYQHSLVFVYPQASTESDCATCVADINRVAAHLAAINFKTVTPVACYARNIASTAAVNTTIASECANRKRILSWRKRSRDGSMVIERRWKQRRLCQIHTRKMLSQIQRVSTRICLTAISMHCLL